MNIVHRSLWRSTTLEGPWSAAVGLWPGVVTGFALLMAAFMDGRDRALGPIQALLVIQALGLALAGSRLSVSAAERLSAWQARVAPLSAQDRTRLGLMLGLASTAGLGLLGPVVLVATWTWRVRPVALGLGSDLLAVVAVLLAALMAGVWSGLAWQGRSPRWGLLGWPLLALGLGLWPLLGMPPAAAGLLLAIAAASAGWLLGRERLFRARRAAWPRLSLGLLVGPRLRHWWVLPFDGEDTWERPDDVGDASQRNHGPLPQLLSSLFAVGLQVVFQHRFIGQMAWGQPVADGMSVFYGLGLFILAALVANFCMVHPGLHWRRRLAPGGMPVSRWAWRTWGGSSMVMSVFLTLCVGAAAWMEPEAQRWTALSALPGLLGDGLLVVSLVFWARGRANRYVLALLPCLALGVAAALLGEVLQRLGWPLERGAAWLLLELACSLLLARQGVQRWARQDLNQLLGRRA